MPHPGYRVKRHNERVIRIIIILIVIIVYKVAGRRASDVRVTTRCTVVSEISYQRVQQIVEGFIISRIVYSIKDMFWRRGWTIID